MECLPYELISLIFSHLSQEDIINLPPFIASNGLSDKDLSSNFGTVDIWLDEQSLEALNRAVKHPLFSDRIHGLRFHTDELAPISSLGFQHRSVAYNDPADYGPQRALHSKTEQIEISSSREMVVWRSGISVETQWHDKYRRYRALYETRMNMRTQKKDLVLLVKALKKLRCQPSIIVDDHYGFTSQSRFPRLLGDAWIEECDRIRSPRRARPNALETVFRSLAYCKLSLSDFEVANTAPPGLTPLSGTLRYIPALHRMVRKSRCYRSNELMAPISSALFKNLRRFRLRSSLAPDYGHNDRIRESKEYRYMSNQPNGYESKSENLQLSLKFILSQCEMLEDLEISFVNEAQLDDRLDGMPYLPLPSIFSAGEWQPGPPSPLRNLTLSNCKISESNLAKFLLRYCETLRTLHFTNLCLTMGSRVTFFELLGGEMSLTSAIFDGFH